MRQTNKSRTFQRERMSLLDILDTAPSTSVEGVFLQKKPPS